MGIKYRLYSPSAPPRAQLILILRPCEATLFTFSAPRWPTSFLTSPIVHQWGTDCRYLLKLPCRTNGNSAQFLFSCPDFGWLIPSQHTLPHLMKIDLFCLDFSLRFSPQRVFAAVSAVYISLRASRRQAWKKRPRSHQAKVDTNVTETVCRCSRLPPTYRQGGRSSSAHEAPAPPSFPPLLVTLRTARLPCHFLFSCLLSSVMIGSLRIRRIDLSHCSGRASGRTPEARALLPPAWNFNPATGRFTFCRMHLLQEEKCSLLRRGGRRGFIQIHLRLMLINKKLRVCRNVGILREFSLPRFNGTVVSRLARVKRASRWMYNIWH